MKIARSAFLAAAFAASSVFAGTTVIQPNESASKDGFVYQAISTLNSDTFGGGTFSTLLSSGATGSGHDTRTFLQFDLSSLGSIASSDITGASITLHVVNNSPFGEGPSSSFSVVADVHAVTASWSENTVTWDTAPTFSSAVATSQTLSATGVDVSFDVTALMKSWIDGTLANNGVAIVQPAVVLDTVSGQKVVATYDSASGTVLPSLTVTSTPEPAAMSFILIGGAMLIARRRRTN